MNRMHHSGSARSTPATPTPSRTSTTTSARRSSPAAWSTCAARSARTSTPGNVGIGDVEAQAEKAMSNIAMLLEEAGGSLEHIVKVTVYLIDIRYREPVYRVMGRWLKGVHPVSTGLVVEALARPEWLVEIDATAVISRRAPTDDVLARRARRRHRRVRHGDLLVEPRGRVAVRARAGRRRGGRVAERHRPARSDPRCSTSSPAVRTPTPRCEAALAQEQFPDYRQLAVVDAQRQHRGAFRGAQPRRAHPRPGRSGGRRGQSAQPTRR